METQGMPVEQVLEMTTFYDRCMPLADLISRGEGNWDSVNRGRAGDTPGGITRVAGRRFAEMTIEEVLWLQRGSIYAVGRYQFIPSTLKMAVKWAGLSWDTKFTNETQNKLFCALLQHKRPQVGEYLLGRGNQCKSCRSEFDIISLAKAQLWRIVASRPLLVKS